MQGAGEMVQGLTDYAAAEDRSAQVGWLRLPIIPVQEIWYPWHLPASILMCTHLPPTYAHTHILKELKSFKQSTQFQRTAIWLPHCSFYNAIKNLAIVQNGLWFNRHTLLKPKFDVKIKSLSWDNLCIPTPVSLHCITCPLNAEILILEGNIPTHNI